MALLYKQLIVLGQCLQLIIMPAGDAENQQPSNSQIPKATFNRLGVQVAKSADLLQEVSSELLDLSVLIPSAPWVGKTVSFLSNTCELWNLSVSYIGQTF